MKIDSNNSFKSLANLEVEGKIYKIFSLKKAEQSGLKGISSLPKSLKILLENLLRFEDNQAVKGEQIQAIKEWVENKSSKAEIAFRPARVLMQDYTGIPRSCRFSCYAGCDKVKKKRSK